MGELRPAVRKEFFESANGMRRNAREDVVEPDERVHLTGSHDATKLCKTAAVRPPTSLPKKVQLLRPTAQPRSVRSV